MTLSSLKLIRQQLLFHYQSKTRLTNKHKRTSSFRRLSISIVCSAVFFPASVVAQITPDNSVPTTVEQEESNMQINGGEREGNNLFHSFDEFSIPEGMEAIFENATDIENIFTRVTGGEVSNIDGILTTQGDANFYFINPNGIVFGDNASLNVGGSFIASSADSVQFEDGSEFSATNPDEPILDLTGFPVGLNLGDNPGAITVNGNGEGVRETSELIDTNSGLRVQPDETLALVGGEIKLDGGTLKTAGGRIELGSVAAPGLVKLDPIEKGFVLSYQEISSLGNIQLLNLAAVDASGDGGGDIQVTGKNLTLLNGGQIVNYTLGGSSGGTLNINVSDTIKMVGIPGQAFESKNTLISTEVFEETSGNAGNIKIQTGKLTLTDEAQIAAGTLGRGNAGNIEILASDSIEISGESVSSDSGFGSAISSVVEPGAVGRGGDIKIETGKLTLTDGGIISSGSFGQGAGGDLFIIAKDSVELVGTSLDGQSPSRISARTEGTEKGGDLSIETGKLSVREGAEVTVGSEETETGDAGTMSINAEDINLDNTGSITAASASGNGGNININTDNLQIDNESQITTEAGNNGDGGNITINTSNLTAKKNSDISTSAVGGDGGNISITADTILGLENSDITANAVGGNGGNINITTDLIYGYQARSQTTPFEDITASSELGIDGTVTINSPETSTEEDLILSVKKIELDKYKKLLTGSCLDENRPIREEFTYSGGGIEENSDDYTYSSEYFTSPNPPSVEEILQQRDNGIPPRLNTTNNTPPIWQPGDPPIQANAVEIRNGRKFLVAINQMTEGGSSLCNPETVNADPTAQIKVKKIKFIGNYVFNDSHLKNISTVLEGSTVGIEDLFAIQTKINQYYIDQGYISSGVFIASQDMTNGVIKVQVIEGTLAELEIKGLSHFKKSYFTKRLPMGEPLKQDKLLNILTKFNNNPLIEDLSAKLIKITPETSRLILKVKEKNPLQTQFAVSNSFSPSVGTYGGEANFNYHFLGNGDLLNFGYSRTNKTGLVRYEAGYTFPINKYDGTINISYTDAETKIVEEPTSALDIQADFKSYKFNIRQPISINNNNISEQFFVEFGLEQITSETFIDNDVSYPFTEGLPDGESKITALRLATEYINRGETSAFLLRSQFNLGIDLLDATVSNRGIDGLFWSWQGKAQWLKKLNKKEWILASNLDIQLTPDKLLPIEQISVGGINSVRGYRQNLSIGDNGVIGSVELQIPLFEFLRFNDGVVKLHPFIDGGGVWNNQDENIEDSILLSFGAGLSMEIGKIVNARVDYGIPLIDDDLPDDFDEGEKLTFSLVVTP
jgi:filamentous hemagglutinin family protein